MKFKYKVGDRVIVEKSNIEHAWKCAGKTGTIVEGPLGRTFVWRVLVDGYSAPIWCDVKCLAEDAKKQDKIVITHDGKTTTATLYRENGSKEVATAKCCPEDTFDFNVGAKLAMERLMKKVEPVPVKKEKYTVGDRIFAEDNINHHPGGAWGTVGEVLDKRIHAEDYLVKFDDGSRLCSHVVPVPTTPEPIDLASKFKTGDYAKIIAKKWGHNFKIGTIVKLEKCEYNYRATADGKSWKVLDDELEAYTPPKYFTGKVVCIENTLDDGEFTIGKIYEIKDGNFTDNRGQIRPKTGGRDRVKTLSDLENEYYSDWYYKFIPIVE